MSAERPDSLLTCQCGTEYVSRWHRGAWNEPKIKPVDPCPGCGHTMRIFQAILPDTRASNAA